MTPFRADTPLQYIKGVGPRVAERFAANGLHCVADLLSHFPLRHEIDLGERPIAEIVPGQIATVRGVVTRCGGRGPRYRATLQDTEARCELVWFHRPPGLSLRVGATVAATGKASLQNDLVQLVQPRIKAIRDDEHAPADNQSRRIGVYSASPPLRSSEIRRAVAQVLASDELPVDEFIPAAILERRTLPDRAAAVRAMHEPTDDAHYAQARRRLAYEEFLLMELAVALRRRKTRQSQAGRALLATPEIDQRIRARFPFELTAAQNAAVAEIVRDLEQGRPMTRLLQGDVGSGKTVVALYACLAAVANRRQAAILAPTELLARQHFANVERYLEGSRVRRLLLRGGLRGDERQAALRALANGDVDLVLGTQALLEEDVAFRDLALVVVDEQHKFGVLQRAAIRTKGPLPHYLVMTATPIPRTLAMTVFGDLDVTVISASPPGRGQVRTRVIHPRQWDAEMAAIAQRLASGEQAYFVCPQIGADEPISSTKTETTANDAPNGEKDVVTALAAYEKLRTGAWSELPVGLLHGGMALTEREQVVDAFRRRELAAIVTTTVVEVGVDVPNASLMVIENADRFGLSQLHQLRGRVGRGERDSECVLVSRGFGENALARLKTLCDTTDGFAIAEADLRLRGPGELFGARQHGLPALRFGDLVADFGLVEEARADAFEIVDRDPSLQSVDSLGLREMLSRQYADRLALLDAG